jgi:peptide deformylase
MIYPIYAYGQPVLKKKAALVELQDDIKKLVADMYETMYHCRGVGLAAPQIGLSKRVFVIDSSMLNDDDERKDKNEDGVKETFINAEMLEEYGGIKPYEEGCLSIPRIYGNVDREQSIRIRYYNDLFELVEKEFTGFTARVIQHEYDHIEGILFIDRLKPIKKQLIKRKLEDVKKGQIPLKYKMKFV